MKKEFIYNEELAEKLSKSGIDKKEFIKAVENGVLNPMVYHPTLKQFMSFRVTKYNDDDSIEGYFLHDKC